MCCREGGRFGCARRRRLLPQSTRCSWAGRGCWAVRERSPLMTTARCPPAVPAGTVSWWAACTCSWGGMLDSCNLQATRNRASHKHLLLDAPCPHPAADGQEQGAGEGEPRGQVRGGPRCALACWLLALLAVLPCLPLPRAATQPAASLTCCALLFGVCSACAQLMHCWLAAHSALILNVLSAHGAHLVGAHGGPCLASWLLPSPASWLLHRPASLPLHWPVPLLLHRPAPWFIAASPADKEIDIGKVTPGARVALRNDSYTLHVLLPTKVRLVLTSRDQSSLFVVGSRRVWWCFLGICTCRCPARWGHGALPRC